MSPPHLVLVVGEHDPGPFAAHRVRRLADAAQAGPVLDDELPRLGTGWRIVAVGTDRDTHLVRAAALARGALGEEIVMIPVESTRKHVHCARCHHRFDTLDDHPACPACGAPLTVAEHFSTRHGAFLGAPR